MEYLDKLKKYMASYLIVNRGLPGFTFRELKRTSLGDVFIGTQNPNKESEYALLKRESGLETVWVWSAGPVRKWYARLTEYEDHHTAEFEFFLPGQETICVIDL